MSQATEVGDAVMAALHEAHEPVREAVLYERARGRGAQIDAEGFLEALEDLVTLGRVRMTVDHESSSRDRAPFGPRFYRPARR